MSEPTYQVIQQGKPCYTGTQQEVIDWAKFHNMQYGDEPMRESGFANFTVKRLDGKPLTDLETRVFTDNCKYQPNFSCF